MRIRKQKPKPRRWVTVASLVLLPIVLLASFTTSIFQQFHSLASFAYEVEPDPATFLTANYTRFGEMAAYYDERFETYHIPLNMSTDTVFLNNVCTMVDYYQYSDNTGQWTGLAITGYVYKYLAGVRENNLTLQDDSLRLIRKLFHGMSMQLAVPNGGLGPEYGAILARGWADPAHRDIAEFYFNDTNRYNGEKYSQHQNGTGIYSDWRWRGFTSLDEYSGFLAGLSFVYKYVHEPDIQALAELMIDQIAFNSLQTNFAGIDWHGGYTGVTLNARFFQGGAWVALVLKLAALAFPEKYSASYYHYVVEELYGLWTGLGAESEVVANYYAFAFDYHIAFALLELEENPKLLALYTEKMNGSLFSFTKTHRNPFFNIIMLLLFYTPGENSILERDVEDQLMRYDCEYHFPDRRVGIKDVSLDPSYVPIDNVIALNDFIDESWLGFLYRPIFFEIEREDFFFSKPLTVEYIPGNIFIWEDNPFTNYTILEEDIDPLYEFAGFNFSLIYWMARGAGFFPVTGLRVVEVGK